MDKKDSPSGSEKEKEKKRPWRKGGDFFVTHKITQWKKQQDYQSGKKAPEYHTDKHERLREK